ncbi:glycine zipper 2TM domain-containing protein [Novosphingobium sp. MMS21-SN21R]|uniref:glycine zipper 2TM domain-containing protein n=1 Tax=Novosphingobium sp. MMS21-SN21R TaxID=2969298 RepID=UPI002884AFCB|nr:glycine zipper domain-containing protein [Novosphingobium sp. MMS21-SN21R]MDT0506491.1 glycine zipper 2TM domain-containing protein [Novosphingobium sp. MMS21-SN21R]
MLRLKTFSAMSGAALVLSALSASPAAAKDHHGGQMHGGWQGQSYGQGPIYYPPMMGAPWPTTVMVQPMNGQQVYPQQAYPQQAYPQQGYPQADPRWNEMESRCRKVYGDRGIGGALLGGLIGGVLGNRVVDGNRTLGTVAGAAVGAIAGTVIDKAEDKDLRRECDDYARSVQQQGAYAPYPAYGASGYAPYGYVMVPVMLPPQKPCVETTVVTERWVDQPVRHRYIPRRAPVIRDKRVKEKRVYTG